MHAMHACLKKLCAVLRDLLDSLCYQKFLINNIEIMFTLGFDIGQKCYRILHV